MSEHANHRTALVVEDEILLGMEVGDLLADEGYAVVEAASASEALLRIDDRISLVVTDIHMPGAMDGLGLAREVARTRPEVAVVVVSAHKTPGPGDLPEDAAFVGRPFLHSRIRAAIRAAVNAKASRRT